MDWFSNKTILRRFLRDPNESIWSASLLKRLWNDAQRSFQQEVNILEDIQNIQIPPFYNFSYMFEWEWPYIGATQGKNYQCLRMNQTTYSVFSYNFELEIDIGLDNATADTGHYFTHPWEAFITGVTPGDVVPVWFPDTFDKALLVAYDRQPLDYISKKDIQNCHSDWKSHAGTVEYYTKVNSVDNTWAIFPLPSSVDWDDTITSPEGYGELYSCTFELEYLTKKPGKFTQYHTTTTTDYLYDWEEEHLDGGACLTSDSYTSRAMWYWEIGDADNVGYYGVLDYSEGQFTDTIGVSTGIQGALSAADSTGAMTGYVTFDDNLCLIYKVAPKEIQDDDDISNFPDFLLKYINHHCLELAYSVNNDGKSESLRDYWTYRKQVGAKMVKAFKSKRKQDRVYRLTTQGQPWQTQKKYPRLPSTYPNI